MTKVSVIIPTYNRAATVLNAVGSALNQSYPHIEVIVVDDGSSDETTELLKDYSSKITVLHQKNSGPSAARNHGARYADGDIFAFLDSDDVWMHDKIQRQVDLMDEYGAHMTCCVCNSLISNGRLVDERESFGIAAIETNQGSAVWKNPGEILASRFLLFNQVAAIRRESFVKVGGYNPKMRLLEDHELALKLSALGGIWGIISMPLVRKHNDTRGLGVVCCENSLGHARAQRVALSSVLESGLVRDGQMRRQLKKRLRANARVVRNETMLANAGWANWSLGRLGSVWSRMGNFIARKGFPKVATE